MNKFICYFVYNLGSYSGAAFQALNVAEALSRPVLIINIGSDFYGEASSNVKIINIGSSSWRAILFLIPYVLLKRLYLIHFHGQFLLPMLFAKICMVPYIVKTTLLNDDDFESLKVKPYGSLRLWLARSCNYNVVLSNKLFSINKKYICDEKIDIVANGVSVSNIPPDFSQKNNSFYFCGVISRRKQTLRAITVFSENYAQLKDAKLYIIGPDHTYGVGKEVDMAYIDLCREYVECSGLRNKVIFTGLLKQREVLNLIHSCKALLFFSDFEGMPNVVLEAMAHNCVPIISSMHGVGEELVGNDAGFVCTEKYPSIDQIDQMIINQHPYKRALLHFSFKSNTQKLQCIYKRFANF